MVVCTVPGWLLDKVPNPAVALEVADILSSHGLDRASIHIRSYESWKLHGDVTIRNSRPNRRWTEADSILLGCTTHLFYGWLSSDGNSLVSWLLLDCERIKKARIIEHCRIFEHIIKSVDDTTFLYLTPRQLLECGCVLASGGQTPNWLRKVA